MTVLQREPAWSRPIALTGRWPVETTLVFATRSAIRFSSRPNWLSASPASPAHHSFWQLRPCNASSQFTATNPARLPCPQPHHRSSNRSASGRMSPSACTALGRAPSACQWPAWHHNIHRNLYPRTQRRRRRTSLPYLPWRGRKDESQHTAWWLVDTLIIRPNPGLSCGMRSVSCTRH